MPHALELNQFGTIGIPDRLHSVTSVLRPVRLGAKSTRCRRLVTTVLNVKSKALGATLGRHVSPLTTTVYTHPSDQELFAQIRGLSC